MLSDCAVSGELLLFRTLLFLIPGSLASQRAAVPLMGMYEQHLCQGPWALKGCDILMPPAFPNVTQRTLGQAYVGSVSAPSPPVAPYDSGRDSQSVKAFDTLFAISFREGKPSVL